MHKDINICKSVGIELRGLKASLAPRRAQIQNPPKLEKYQFVPYDNNQLLAEDLDKSRKQSLTVLLQTVLENSSGALKLKISEISENRPAEVLLSPTVLHILESEPMVAVDLTTITRGPVELYSAHLEASGIKVAQKNASDTSFDQNLHLVIGYDLLSTKSISILQNSIDSLKSGGMILLEEINGRIDMNTIKKLGLELISKQFTTSNAYLLLRKVAEIPSDNIIIQITETNFSWVEPLKEALKKSETDNTKIYLVVQNEELTGAVGMMNCIMREPGGANARLVFIQDAKSEKFSTSSEFYSQQLVKDLVMNVLKNGVWGSYRHITLENTIDGGKLQVEHAYINALTRGDLSSLRWIEGPLSYYK